MENHGINKNYFARQNIYDPEIFPEIACWRFSRVNKVVIIPGLVPPISPAGAALPGQGTATPFIRQAFIGFFVVVQSRFLR